MTFNQPICFSCKHYDVDRGSCPAFPDEIPDEIYYGTNEHGSKIKDQTGEFVFEETDESKQKFPKRIPNK
jgi:hypothetical protein